MARSLLSTVSLCSLVIFGLSACQTAPTAPPKEPVALTAQDPAIVDDGAYRNLEMRVETLEGKMRVAEPTLKKIDAIEGHFKALSIELDKIAAENNLTVAATPSAVVQVPAVEKTQVMAPVAELKKEDAKPVAKPEVKKAEPKKEMAKPNASAQVLAVTSVRIGDQPKNITRIVLDTTKPAEIHYDLDNSEGLLVVDIPKAKWSTTESQALKKSPMVKSFKAVTDESGAHFVTELKQKAKVIATARLAPSGGSGNRVYIDIAPAQ